MRREQLEEQITARLETVLKHDTQDWYSAKIIPAKETRKDWRVEGPSLQRQIRINILDAMRREDVVWGAQ